jgi:proteic killer suppression protein
MIRSFKCKETEKAFNLEPSKKLPFSIQKVLLRKLEMLDYAVSLQDLRVPPANKLESLKGDRRGQHSIRVNDQWRVCFVWHDGCAYGVEVVDYH